MAQHDYVIANGTGAAVRSDLNDALAAIVSNNSGATEPTTTYAYMWWPDTSTGLLKLRNGANNAWITLRELDGTLTIESGTVSAPGLAFASDLNTGIWSPGADQFAIATNGVERVEWGTSEVVFNDGGENYDFRIEGDTNANLLLVDASDDSVSLAGLKYPKTDGSANQLLKTDGSGNLGFSAETLPGVAGTLDRLNRAGNVLQVINASTSTNTVNNTNVYADTTLTASITPTSASNKILVLVNQAGLYKTGDLNSGVTLQLLRDSTSLIEFAIGAGYTGTIIDNIPNAATTSYLDSPNTTSSVTYKTQFKNGVNAGGVRVQANSSFSTITLLEVAA